MIGKGAVRRTVQLTILNTFTIAEECSALLWKIGWPKLFVPLASKWGKEQSNQQSYMPSQWLKNAVNYCEKLSGLNFSYF